MHATVRTKNAHGLGALAVLVLAGCASAPQRFPLRDPLWVDDDQRAFGPPPASHDNSWVWDAADNTVFRPLAELWEHEGSSEAINVSSIDEVPSSSWFENRIGRRAMSLEEVAAGACAEWPVPPTPWTIVDGKDGGDTPGFIIEFEGHRYLFKTDIRRPELTTAADAIATRLFHAVGYSTPCNHVVSIRPEDLVIAPDAERGDDSGAPLTEADVAQVLRAALRTADGRLRGSLSRYIDGEPLGGWRFDGRRNDDPNDIIPHQHRREVRAMYVLSAWLNHVDSRADNNFDAWVATDGSRGHVRHYVLDLGDCFGLVWEGSDELTRRFGHSHYLDLEHIGVDLLSLGIVERPYREDPSERVHPMFTYYDVEHFVPDQWRNGYPNAGFERRTERDTAWMARILSQLSEDHLRAIVGTGRFSDPDVERDLVRILRGRQQKILERHLTRLSPLAFASVVPSRGRSWLCMRDLAVESGLRPRQGRGYRATASIDWPDSVRPVALEHRSSDGHVCALLPELSAPEPRYLVVDVVAGSAGRETTGAVSVHLYQTGPNQHRVVGLRRADPG